MHSRRRRNWLVEPVCIYEVHLGSWRRNEDNSWLSYRQLADQLIPYVKQMGFTHIENSCRSWSIPTTPPGATRPSGYFAATSRLGSPSDFMLLRGSLPSRKAWA